MYPRIFSEFTTNWPSVAPTSHFRTVDTLVFSFKDTILIKQLIIFDQNFSTLVNDAMFSDNLWPTFRGGAASVFRVVDNSTILKIEPGRFSKTSEKVPMNTVSYTVRL
jgi:hypothetical protein